MSGGGYLRVLRQGPAARPFVAAVLARLQLSMAPLGTLLLVQHERGSYALAGVVTAAFTVGTAVGSPTWGRLMDRFGQARVIAPCSVVGAVLLAALAVATVGSAPSWALLLLAFGSGVSVPPITAAMRAAWRVVLDDETDHRAGYVLDAVAVEAIFVGGPVLLSVMLGGPPVLPLLVTAALLLGGGLTYAASRPARVRPQPQPADAHLRRRDLARAPGLLPVLATAAGIAVGFGCIDTSLAATARGLLHHQGLLGWLYAGIAGGSVVGGLLYGTLPHDKHEHRRLPVTLAGMCLGLVLVTTMVATTTLHLALLLPLLLVTGLCIAPTLVIQQNVVDRATPAGHAHESQSWLSTATTTGAAAGTSVAGAVIDRAGVPYSFGAAALAVAVTCLVAVAAQRVWRRTA